MKNPNQGFSLIEFLIAVAVGFIILTGVMTLYLSQMQTYRTSQNLERMQENARLASQQMTQDLKSAGFIGCTRLNEITLQNSAGTDFSFETSLVGFHDGYTRSSYSSPSVTSILQMAIPQTDQILMQFVNSELTPAKTENSAIKIFANANFNLDNILLIANCDHADLFKINKIQKQFIIPADAVSENYSEKDSLLGRMVSIIYYLADTGRKTIAGDPVYALYRRDLTAPPTKQNELIEGIEDMQIRYGVINKGNIHYYTADQVSQWEKVRVVQIALLLTSPDAVFSQPEFYRFLNRKKIALDRRMRREWDIVVALRER